MFCSPYSMNVIPLEWMTLVLLAAANISWLVFFCLQVSERFWKMPGIKNLLSWPPVVLDFWVGILYTIQVTPKPRSNALKFTEPLVFAGITLPLLSPFTKYTAMINKAVPFNYPGKHSHCSRRSFTSLHSLFSQILTFFICSSSSPGWWKHARCPFTSMWA